MMSSADVEIKLPELNLEALKIKKSMKTNTLNTG